MINNKKKPLTWEQRFRRLVHFGHDKAPETEILQSISEGVEFHGARLWILVLAVFVRQLVNVWLHNNVKGCITLAGEANIVNINNTVFNR